MSKLLERLASVWTEVSIHAIPLVKSNLNLNSALVKSSTPYEQTKVLLKKFGSNLLLEGLKVFAYLYVITMVANIVLNPIVLVYAAISLTASLAITHFSIYLNAIIKGLKKEKSIQTQASEESDSPSVSSEKALEGSQRSVIVVFIINLFQVKPLSAKNEKKEVPPPPYEEAVANNSSTDNVGCNVKEEASATDSFGMTNDVEKWKNPWEEVAASSHQVDKVDTEGEKDVTHKAMEPVCRDDSSSLVATCGMFSDHSKVEHFVNALKKLQESVQGVESCSDPSVDIHTNPWRNSFR